MADIINLGRLEWLLDRDAEGHRDYTVKWLLKTNDSEVEGQATGPWEVMQCEDLPKVGQHWLAAHNGDPSSQELDTNAFCHPDMTVAPVVDKETSDFWIVSQKFSTRPIAVKFGDLDNFEKDPLLEPVKVGGSYVKYTEVRPKDSEGKAITNSSHEPFHGKEVEKDCNRATVWVECQTDILPLAIGTEFLDTLNRDTLWGLPPASIKLSNLTWERLVHINGAQELRYIFKTRYEFDIRVKPQTEAGDPTGYYEGDWTQEILDHGHTLTQVAGTDPVTDPNKYIRHKDGNDENLGVHLDGKGRKLTDLSQPVYLEFKFYPATSDFTQLAINFPVTLDS
jgi:hypothetical protein